MEQIKIIKQFEKSEYSTFVNIKIVIPFYDDQMVLNLIALDPDTINWSDFITKSENFEELSDSQGYLAIIKKDNRVYFESKSPIGFMYTFSVPSEAIEDEFKKLDEWIKEIKN